MNTDAQQAAYEDRISLSDILAFFRESLWIIGGVGIAGVLGAGAFLMTTPPQFEARIQLEMAQIRNNAGGSNTGIRGVSIEDPNLLVERLRMPSSYSAQAIQSCGFGESPASAEAMAGLIKTVPMKKVPSVVEISLRRTSVDLAGQCARAVFEMIRQQQADLSRPLIEQAQQRLNSIQAKLRENQNFLVKMEKANMSSAVYLSKRDETLYLMDQLAAIESILAPSDSYETRLISPIYVSSNAVFPRKSLVLTLGAAGGLLAGLLLALGRRILTGWRSKNA